GWRPIVPAPPPTRPRRRRLAVARPVGGLSLGGSRLPTAPQSVDDLLGVEVVVPLGVAEQSSPHPPHTPHTGTHPRTLGHTLSVGWPALGEGRARGRDCLAPSPRQLCYPGQ